MIGEGVIRAAMDLAGTFKTAALNGLETKAGGLLRQLADFASAENARRKLLAEATGLEAEPGEAEAATLAWLARAVAADGPPRAVLHACRFEFQHIASHVSRLEARCGTLEALLMDAEDTLRARAEGRRAGLLEAAEMAGSPRACWGRPCAACEDLAKALRSMALPSAGKSGQEG